MPIAYVNSSYELGQLVKSIEADQSILVLAHVSIGCRQDIACTRLSQASKQARAGLTRLVLERYQASAGRVLDKKLPGPGVT